MAKSVDPDQTAPEEQSDQGLQCLPKHLCPNILGNQSILCTFSAYKYSPYI